MANDLKGEVRFEVDGTAYKMRFTCNALYEHIEKSFGMSFMEVISSFDKGELSLGSIRQLMYAGLVGSHTEITLDDCGALIDALGMMKVIEIIGESLAASLGTDDNGSKKKKAKK